MAETWFYHLEQRTVEQTLPVLLEKALAKGWRALVRTATAESLSTLDELLWTYDDAAFLPHGRADAAQPDRQPVLLTTAGENANGAQMAVLLDGVEPIDSQHLERTVVLFSAQHETALRAARTQWKSLRAIDAPVSYWKEGTSGSWEKKA